jgi:hypothetical protein
VAYLGEVLTDSLTKKQSLITTIMEVLSNIPRVNLKRAWRPFISRLEDVFAAKGNFHPLNVKSKYKSTISESLIKLLLFLKIL